MSAFSIGATLLDAMVLAVLSKEDTYGYQITKDIQAHFAVSESTLYPVLRRLQKNGSLTTYDSRFRAETAAITASPFPAEHCWNNTERNGAPINSRWIFSWTKPRPHRKSHIFSYLYKGAIFT